MGLKRFVLGNPETIAGTVYGTIIVLSVLVAGAKPYEHHLWRLDAIAATSAVVLWVAHVYSHGLGESLKLGRRLTFAELVAIARREYSIVAAAIPPVAVLALGAAGVVTPRTAIWLVFAVGAITLAAQGIRYARLERLSRPATILTVIVNLALGLSLVTVEVLISH
jgi:hypothetical protein